MESVAVLDQDVKKAFVNKEAVVGVFLDIEKAWGRCGSGGRAVFWQSEGCRFDPTLGVSKCP